MLPFSPYIVNPLNTEAPIGFMPQQVTGNPINLLPNLMQMQSQVGFINPQHPVPFNGSNQNLGTPNMPNQPPGLMNVLNQNGHMGKSILGSGPSMLHPVQSQVVFGPQNSIAVPGFPMSSTFGTSTQSLNNFRPNQPSGQFAHNPVNALNQNFGGFQNGQLGWQNQSQNVNQHFNLPWQNPSLAAPFARIVGCGNQRAEAMVPQNSAFVANPQIGLLQNNSALQQNNLAQNNLAPCMIGMDALKHLPASIQQMQGNLLMPSTSVSSQLQQNLEMTLQGNSATKDGMHISASGHDQNKKFKRDPKSQTSNWRFQKTQMHHVHNVKGNHKFPNQSGGKGSGKDRARNSGLDSSVNQSKGGRQKSLAMHYTEKEVQQWREERRKNYPTSSNVEKKLAHRHTNSEAVDNDVKIRRQQLKEILAKQAELGFEVPEIPSYYLSDLVGQKRRPFNKNDRFLNRHNKRGRFDHNDQFSEKRGSAEQRPFDKQRQRFKKRERVEKADTLPLNTPANLRKPTLLQKLLSADVRRDKSRILQAFRFMVMNSFFKDWPEKKPLKYPKVIVKEAAGSEGEVVEDQSLSLAEKMGKYEEEEGEITD
ncbi:hypothetical protein Nepgr_015106 [Nepenthes gracilis]|uniref:FMR1-interacting protein 1 conserved domain-containing protein n=1 Tax=Nepenthes gracilis TaxID=150966 RepID=A0AAD3SKH2_NEPGR|nr:hypothetical protein Nepgr_015106 [Nepenthes gracilis]